MLSSELCYFMSHLVPIKGLPPPVHHRGGVLPLPLCAGAGHQPQAPTSRVIRVLCVICGQRRPQLPHLTDTAFLSIFFLRFLAAKNLYDPCAFAVPQEK